MVQKSANRVQRCITIDPSTNKKLDEMSGGSPSTYLRELILVTWGREELRRELEQQAATEPRS